MIQDIPITFHENIKKEMDIKARILNKKGKIKNLKLFDNKIMIKNKSDEKSFIRMTNKIEKVDLLGDYLRRGEFEKLLI